MTPLNVVSIAATMTLYLVVALVAMYAWHDRQYLLAVPLTAIFLVSTVAVMWVFDRWGT